MFCYIVLTPNVIKMNLEKELKKQGYDLIKGSVRNQKLLQIWNKNGNDPITYYGCFRTEGKDSIMKSLYPSFNDLNISSTINDNTLDSNVLQMLCAERTKMNGAFGATFLSKILGKDYSNTVDGLFSKQNDLTMSYKQVFSQVVPKGKIDVFFSQANLDHLPKVLTKDWNRKNMYIISSLILAKEIMIENNGSFDLDIEAHLSNASELSNGQFSIETNSNSSFSMSFQDDFALPVAVKAYRLDFNNNNYKKARMVTDNKNFFE